MKPGPAKWLTLPGLALVLAACSQFTLIEPGRIEVGGVYTVQPGIAWNRSKAGKRHLWTVDGPLLQDLFFINGLEQGDPLFRGGALARMAGKKKKKPVFSSDMTAIEIKEFIEASFVLNSYAALKTTRLRPIKFGTAPGFRFEFTYALKEGLEKRGFAVGMVRRKRLHLILYRGTRLYYFGKYEAEVERIIRSIRLL